MSLSLIDKKKNEFALNTYLMGFEFQRAWCRWQLNLFKSRVQQLMNDFGIDQIGV